MMGVDAACLVLKFSMEDNYEYGIMLLLLVILGFIRGNSILHT